MVSKPEIETSRSFIDSSIFYTLHLVTAAPPILMRFLPVGVKVCGECEVLSVLVVEAAGDALDDGVSPCQGQVHALAGATLRPWP